MDEKQKLLCSFFVRVDIQIFFSLACLTRPGGSVLSFSMVLKGATGSRNFLQDALHPEVEKIIFQRWEVRLELTMSLAASFHIYKYNVRLHKNKPASRKCIGT